MATQSLVPGLSFRSSNEAISDILPANGGSVAVIDHIDSPAHWLLVRAAAAVLKRPRGQGPSQWSKCIFMTFTQDTKHWRAIMDKMNVNCARATEQGSLSFVDMFSFWRSDASSSTSSAATVLDEAYTRLQAELAASDSGSVLVLVDDLAHLEWTGPKEERTLAFLRGLKSLIRQTGGSLLAIYHALSVDPPISAAYRYLVETCNARIECRPLASGRSGTVSGEMYVRKGPEAWPDEVSIPQQSVLHYRCTETGAVIFEKGSSALLS